MPKYPAEHYTRDECRAILDACGTTWTGLRNRVLIILLWRCGLRLFEALALMSYDVDFEHNSIRVRHGKGDKPRTVGFDNQTKGVLMSWVYDQPGGWVVGAPIVSTRDGKPLQQSYVRGLFPRLAKKAGVERRIHAHGFRHTFAVELLREGVSVVNIQRLLGHSSLQTTAIYLASLSPEEALDAVRSRTW